MGRHINYQPWFKKINKKCKFWSCSNWWWIYWFILCNKFNRKLAIDNNNGIRQLLNPYPCNYKFDVIITTKNLEDSLEIIEQITTKFQPDYTLTIIDIPEINLISDVNVILESITSNDNYITEDIRYVEWVLSFNVTGYLYPKLYNSNI